MTHKNTVTFAGCGDAFGSGGRFNSCFVVDVEGFRYAIEFGATSLVALQQAGMTTPDPISLQEMLVECTDAGVEKVAIEVSSHALDQGRCDEVAFDAAVFTNLSRDHLDYHGTMEAYAAAKRRLFIDCHPRFAAA